MTLTDEARGTLQTLLVLGLIAHVYIHRLQMGFLSGAMTYDSGAAAIHRDQRWKIRFSRAMLPSSRYPLLSAVSAHA